MKRVLKNKQIVLGVTGGIAAYKSADLVRRLRELGAMVRVVMTEGGKQFITPLTMQAVSGNPVHEDLFDLKAEAAMGHIELARWADVILVAPATADFMAHLARGDARDLLLTLCLASRAPIAIAPAMNQGMWKNTTTQKNLQALIDKGIHIFGPGEGSQACGEIGPGRMLEPLEIIEHLNSIFATGVLSGKKVVITAGPTQEAIDPVRYISNASSGKMGYALAEAARDAGAEVILISGPVNLEKPQHIECIDVISADEMLNTVKENIEACDIFISVAAVADYRCKSISKQKISKQENETLNLILEKNPDILATVAHRTSRPTLVIGFAAETENVIENAKAKLIRKNADMIIANHALESIGHDENEVTVLTKEQEITLPRMSKNKLARTLINLISRK